MSQIKRGFTLIELAIVIVIAGILAAIAVPIYGVLVEDAKWSEGEAIVGAVDSALRVHITENNGIALTADSGHHFAQGTEGETWGEELGIAPDDIDDSNYFTAEDLTLHWAGDGSGSDVNYMILLDGDGDPEGFLSIVRDREPRLEKTDTAPTLN